jgi:hypothetical protein
MKITKSKKGYAYFVELVLSIILVFIILSGYIESEQVVFTYKQNEDLRINGWHILENLDNFNAINYTNITKLDTYIDASLTDFTNYDLELYNNSGCYPIDNGIISSTNYTRCPSINATTKDNIISTFYTSSQQGEPQSIRIYLWRKL